MSQFGPIIIVEDDLDDQQIVQEILIELAVKNPIRFFSTCQEVIPYLLSTPEKPFIILSDVNLPGMNGAELKMKINENEFLRKKAVPFIFFTTSANKKAVDMAYDMMVQGYFEKEDRLAGMKATLRIIVEYWTLCKHPNNF